MITIVDYGMGNIGSILNMLKRIGAEARTSNQPEEVRQATKLILPGVGAFGQAMRNLESSGLGDVLRQRVEQGRVPLLGICLGMQLLTRSSEEGGADGFGWVKGRTVKFRAPESGPAFKVPHMGWNTIAVTRPNPLFATDGAESRFYFVHSYHVDEAGDDTIATAMYGYPFACAVMNGNVLGVQFHPEKSHRFGLDLLTRFAAWTPAAIGAGAR